MTLPGLTLLCFAELASGVTLHIRLDRYRNKSTRAQDLGCFKYGGRYTEHSLREHCHLSMPQPDQACLSSIPETDNTDE